MSNTAQQAALSLAHVIHMSLPQAERRHTSLENVQATVNTMFALGMTVSRGTVAEGITLEGDTVTVQTLNVEDITV